MNFIIFQKITSIRSGHRANIFSAKYLPFTGDSQVSAKYLPFTGDSQVSAKYLPFTGDSQVSAKYLPFTGDSQVSDIFIFVSLSNVNAIFSTLMLITG